MSRKEALVYEAVCNALRSSQTMDDATKTVFEKVRLVARHDGTQWMAYTDF